MDKLVKKMNKLEKEKKILRSIIDDTLWMAIRYAHGRHTYAPSMVRDAVKTLKKLYPNFKLRKDIVIKAPKHLDVSGFIFRSDWLDDLFEEDTK